MLSLMVCMVYCSKCPVESTFTTSIDLQPIGQVPVRGNPFLNKRPNDCSSQSYQVLLSPEQLTAPVSAPFEEAMSHHGRPCAHRAKSQCCYNHWTFSGCPLPRRSLDVSKHVHVHELNEYGLARVRKY